MIPDPFSPINSVVFSPFRNPPSPGSTPASDKILPVDICQMAEAAGPSTWRLWSDNPNAPNILYFLYVDEKVSFAGIRFGSILYGTRKTLPPPHSPTRVHPVRSIITGIVVALFFRCMAALLRPIHLRGDAVKWGLVSYTVVMFSFATVFAATNLTVQSNSYIDNRGFGVIYQNGPRVPYLYGPFMY